jgi:diguanylate cyclase (GGDEF)-like protein
MTPEDEARDLAGLDQTLSDSEQSGADVDQVLSDSDQTGSEKDQISSDRDQAAADIDQALSDDASVEHGDPAVYEQTRRMRENSKLDRHTARRARGTSSVMRDRVAEQRDGLASARDLMSAARDQLAETLDAEIERLAREGAAKDAQLSDREGELGAPPEPRLGEQSRTRAALQRLAAAEDRASAARDREFAALDRKAYARELAIASTDEVTGALRRGVGLAALQREMDRTKRTGEQLIVVFVDVDGLKAVNDNRGHSAGDAMLRTVARVISDEFRSYDLILRFGGDEFVCSFSGDGLDEIAQRFQQVGVNLDRAIASASISIGVTQRRSEDTIQTLLDRADATMIATRRECSARLARIEDLARKASLPREAREL